MNQYLVKFQRGASGVKRFSWDSAIESALMYRPSVVYKVGNPNVKLATVHLDGGIDLTPEGAAEQQ